jgi:hypothetical protein
MSTLFKFELLRLRNKKLLLLMPLVFIVIGIAGMLLSNMFFQEVNGQIKILSVLNAYNQFTFIFFSFIYIYIFSTDIKNGINVYMTQIGYSVKQIIACKTMIMYGVSLISSNLILIVLFFMLGNHDVSYLSTILLDLDINLIFIILFSLLLSLIFKNTMTATLICFAMFIVFNTVNMVGFGLFNQADPNSISYNAILASIGQTVTHRSLSKLEINLADYKYLLIMLPNAFWILLLMITNNFLIRKRGNKIEL